MKTVLSFQLCEQRREVGGGGDELGAGWTGWSTGSYHNCLVSFTFLSGLLRSGAVLFDVEHLSSHRERCG